MKSFKGSYIKFSFILLMIVLLLSGCGNLKDSPISETELHRDENKALRLDEAELIIKTGELNDKYELVDMTRDIYAVIEKVLSVRGENYNIFFYKYDGEEILDIGSDRSLEACISEIDTLNGSFVLQFNGFDLEHKLMFTKEELLSWEKKIAQLNDSGILIDDKYYEDIAENLLFSVTDYNIDEIEKGKIDILAEVRTVGSMTPYIRDEAWFSIDFKSGKFSLNQIVFLREIDQD